MKISVCCITYNHALFIEDALRGFLAQEVNMPWEIVISDDYSTDGTRDILLRYKSMYPERIRLFLNERNIGMMPNFIQAMKSCNGEYIALCEGDDYWTDKTKLQQQLDFLETNPDYSLVHHPCDVISRDRNLIKTTNQADKGYAFTFEDILQRDWFIMTCSMFFRRSSMSFPEWLLVPYNGDYAVQFITVSKGKAYCLEQTMGVYRIHPGGVSQRYDYSLGLVDFIQLLQNLDRYTKFIHHDVIRKRADKTRDRLIEEFAHLLLKERYFSFRYLLLYVKLIKYMNSKRTLHWKYLIRFLFPK